MAHGRDADFPAMLYEFANHPRTGMGFPSTRRALNWEHRFIQMHGNPFGSRNSSLAIRQDHRLVTRESRRYAKQ